MSAIRTALAMSAIPVPETLAMEALHELDLLEKQLSDVKNERDKLQSQLAHAHRRVYDVERQAYNQERNPE